MVTLSSLRRLVETQQGTTGLDSAAVISVAGSGVSVYDTLDSLPLSNLTVGDEAFVKSNNRLYVSNGSGWYNTLLVNRSPRWDSGGEPNTSYTIIDSATPLTIIARAVDSDNPDSKLLNQSFASDSAQYIANITIDSSVFTFTPKSADSIGIEVANGNLADSDTSFTYTFKWSDGISILTKAATIGYSAGQAAAAGYRYIKVVINSVQGGGTQAQVTELSIADPDLTSAFVTAASFTAYSGSVSTDPNTYLNTNTTGSSSYHTNLTGLPFSMEIDLGASYDLGTGFKYLQIGTSDDANRFPSNVSVYGANSSDYSDQVAIVENVSVPAYATIREMKVLDLETGAAANNWSNSNTDRYIAFTAPADPTKTNFAVPGYTSFGNWQYSTDQISWSTFSTTNSFVSVSTWVLWAGTRYSGYYPSGNWTTGNTNYYLRNDFIGGSTNETTGYANNNGNWP